MSIYPPYRPDSNFNDESRDFIVKINGEEAYVHRVYVDMHSVQSASMVAFDLDSPATIEIEYPLSFAWRYKIRPEGKIISPGIHNNDIVSSGETAVLLPGVHFIGGCSLNMKNDSSIFISGGAVLVGSIDCTNVKNVTEHGRNIRDNIFIGSFTDSVTFE